MNIEFYLSVIKNKPPFINLPNQSNLWFISVLKWFPWLTDRWRCGLSSKTHSDSSLIQFVPSSQVLFSIFISSVWFECVLVKVCVCVKLIDFISQFPYSLPLKDHISNAQTRHASYRIEENAFSIYTEREHIPILAYFQKM